MSKNCHYDLNISNLSLSVLLICFTVVPLKGHSAPLESTPKASSKTPVHWNSLSTEEFIIETKYHKLRVELISSLIARRLGFDTTITIALSKVHDDSKFDSDLIKELSKNYGRSLSDKDEGAFKIIKTHNQRDHELTFNKLKELDLFDGQAINPRALEALFAIDMADKFDRYLFPKVLAEQLYKIRGEPVNSPEFGKIMTSIDDYYDLKSYAASFLYEDVEKIEELMSSVEKNYKKWIVNRRLIPYSLYKNYSCNQLFAN